VDAEAALLEYLDMYYHLGRAGKALDRFGVVDFVTTIAPGLRDVLLTGKVYEAARRKVRGEFVYDAVVLDAPPTGRIPRFLNVNHEVAGLAKVGPIRSQADSIMRLLRSATTAVHFVTLLEDMPVTETEEAIAALRPTQIRIGTVIENMVTPTPLDHDQLQTAATGSVALKVPGLTIKQNQALASEFAIEAARTLQQEKRHDQLSALGLPLAQIAFDPGGIDEGAILAIAEQLTDQMSLEAA
jgi:anion-transporting  ArsA/GET3 family ATPase